MSEKVPDRIYILWTDGLIYDWADVVREGSEHTEYRRADLVDAEIARLRAERDKYRGFAECRYMHIHGVLCNKCGWFREPPVWDIDALAGGNEQETRNNG